MAWTTGPPLSTLFLFPLQPAYYSLQDPTTTYPNLLLSLLQDTAGQAAWRNAPVGCRGSSTHVVTGRWAGSTPRLHFVCLGLLRFSLSEAGDGGPTNPLPQDIAEQAAWRDARYALTWVFDSRRHRWGGLALPPRLRYACQGLLRFSVSDAGDGEKS